MDTSEGRAVHGTLQVPLRGPALSEQRTSSLGHGGSVNSSGAACGKLDYSLGAQLMLSTTISPSYPVCMLLHAN